MTVNPSGWRPSAPANEPTDAATVTGNRALMLEEPLLFEIGDTETTGVDFDPPRNGEGDNAQHGGGGVAQGSSPPPSALRAATSPSRGGSRLAGLQRNRPIGLAGLTEPQAVRHYTRLSRQNYAIDLGLFPLGSCTMKHNPRLNEKVARLPGFADVHPLQPQETVQGALQAINELAFWLLDLTGMHGVAMSPKAGAHGELCGLLCIRAALEARGDAREVVLVPESAHGTNPATAAFAGYRVENIPANKAGRVDLDALKARL
ncbi:MAG TPA: aminomethyl-transferring glycine dehydrogenase subunit GcvPB, partial [Sphingomicrobium sp.]|nr:aminomethyl-transferring glycine dehydrogenase subunit GcvPB [Sphingomicrobium sp.]